MRIDSLIKYQWKRRWIYTNVCEITLNVILVLIKNHPGREIGE